MTTEGPLALDVETPEIVEVIDGGLLWHQQLTLRQEEWTHGGGVGGAGDTDIEKSFSQRLVLLAKNK